MFKNNALFRSCVTKINNTLIDNAEHLDIVMPKYNLLEYIPNYKRDKQKTETKDINVKAFDITTNKNEAKAVKKYISYDSKCKFNSAICNSNQKWNNKTCECECKTIEVFKR